MLPLIEHVMTALYPRTDELPGVEDTEPREFLERYRRESPLLIWLGIVAGTFAFVLCPILTVYWPLPSFLLPAKTLDRHAYRVTTTRIYLLRQAVFLVKMAAGMCWAQHPSIRERFAMAPYPEDPGTFRT